MYIILNSHVDLMTIVRNLPILHTGVSFREVYEVEQSAGLSCVKCVTVLLYQMPA